MSVYSMAQPGQKFGDFKGFVNEFNRFWAAGRRFDGRWLVGKKQRLLLVLCLVQLIVIHYATMSTAQPVNRSDVVIGFIILVWFTFRSASLTAWLHHIRTSEQRSAVRKRSSSFDVP